MSSSYLASEKKIGYDTSDLLAIVLTALSMKALFHRFSCRRASPHCWKEMDWNVMTSVIFVQFPICHCWRGCRDDRRFATPCPPPHSRYISLRSVSVSPPLLDGNHYDKSHVWLIYDDRCGLHVGAGTHRLKLSIRHRWLFSSTVAAYCKSQRQMLGTRMVWKISTGKSNLSNTAELPHLLLLQRIEYLNDLSWFSFVLVMLRRDLLMAGQVSCSEIRPDRRWPRHACVCGVHTSVRVCGVHTCERMWRVRECVRLRVSATRECACACADVCVPVYLVQYVYYMTPFDIL